MLKFSAFFRFNQFCLLFQIGFDTQAIESRIQRKSFLNVFCSSSEIVRIWNYHAISKLNPSKCTPGILGFEEFELKDYFHDFLSHNIDPAFKKQFDEIHKLISNEIPNYGGKHRLLSIILRTVINQQMAIPIKSLWINSKYSDFHFYCESIFWSKICGSIDSFYRKPGLRYVSRLISARAHNCKDCDKCFGSLSASQSHSKKVHGRELTINFDIESESCSDSEEDKWIAIQCQKCYTLLMTEASLKNHNRFHEHYDRKPETNVEIQQKIQKIEPTSDFSSDSEPELYEKPVKVSPNYKCQLCQETFEQKDTCMNHIQEVHKIVKNEHNISVKSSENRCFENHQFDYLTEKRELPEIIPGVHYVSENQSNVFTKNSSTSRQNPNNFVKPNYLIKNSQTLEEDQVVLGQEGRDYPSKNLNHSGKAFESETNCITHINYEEMAKEDELNLSNADNLDQEEDDEEIDVIEPNLTKILQSMPHVSAGSNGIDFSKMTSMEIASVKTEMLKYCDEFQYLRCKFCSKLFQSHEKFEIHMDKDHDADAEGIGHDGYQIFICMPCRGQGKRKMFRSKEGFHIHFNESHMSELNPYNLTKVLQYLGEEPKNEKSEKQKSRQKRKKLAKKAKKVKEIEEAKENANKDSMVKSQESSAEDDSLESKSESSENIQDIIDDDIGENNIKDPIEDSKLPNLEQANKSKDFPNVEGATGISGSSLEISSYIDSLELENRCLKVSQQFYETTKLENMNLKKELKRLQEILALEQMKNESAEQENQRMRQKLQNIEETTEESQKCKICMEGNLEIVFIPCGHLFTCTNCAPSCKNCPLCRKPAKHMKIYLP